MIPSYCLGFPPTFSFFSPYESQEYEVIVGEVINCTENESIGFNWQNQQWNTAFFKPKNYIMKKIDHTVQFSEGIKSECFIEVGDYNDFTENKINTTLHRCYTIAFTGENPYLSLCKEIYSSKKLKKISCNGGEFTFHPNGLFIKSPSKYSKNLVKEPEADYKDSVVVSHGSCNKI